MEAAVEIADRLSRPEVAWRALNNLGVSLVNQLGDVRRSTEIEYACERSIGSGSSDSSIPSITRTGSNTRTSSPCSRPVSNSVSSSVPTSTRSRSSGQTAVASFVGSPGAAI